MKKIFFICVAIFCYNSNIYCQNWVGGVSYSTQSGSCNGQPLNWVGPNLFVSNGIARVPGNVGSCSTVPSTYFTQIEMRDTLCVTNNFSFEVSIRNNTIFRHDIGISLIGSGQNTGCYLIGHEQGNTSDQQAAAQFSSAFVGGTTITNNTGLTFPTDNQFHTYRLTYNNNVLIYFRDNMQFFSLPYTGNICNINNIRIAFKGSGEVDWMRVLDANGNPIWREDFNAANQLVPFPNLCNPNLTANLSFIAPTCTINTLQLTATPNVANTQLSYQWSGPNGFTSNLQNPSIPNPTLSNTGTYTCTTRVNNCNNNFQTNSIAVSFSLPSIPSTTGNNTVCVGGSTTLNNSFVSGTWSSSNTSVATVSSTGVVTGVTSGTVNINYGIPNTSCNTSFPLNVVPIVAPITGSNTVCVNGRILLSNTTPNGYWQSSNTNVATVDNNGVVTGISPGTVDIIYYIGGGANICRSKTTITVTSVVAVDLTVNANPNPTCTGQNVTLTTTPTFSNISWLIISRNEPFATLSCNTCSSTVFSSNTAGTYNVLGTGVDANGCDIGQSTFINVIQKPATPTVQSPLSICAGNMPQQLLPSGSGFQWYNASMVPLASAPYTSNTKLAGETETYYIKAVNGICSSPIVTQVINYINCCNDICYWTVNGNNINGNDENRVNIFGTLTNDDIRIKTNNLDRAVYSKDGRYGLNTGYPVYPLSTSPSTLFHINCNYDFLKELGDVGPSAVRLENLQETESGNILIIDRDGYVFRSKNLIGEQMQKLEKKVNELTQKLNEAYKIIEQKYIKLEPAQEDNSILQNIPNPFRGKTSIEYNITNMMINAMIIITDTRGKELKRFVISNKGKGVLNVDASSLGSGIYNYSLIVDGKIISTKQMFLSKN